MVDCLKENVYPESIFSLAPATAVAAILFVTEKSISTEAELKCLTCSDIAGK